MIINDPMMWHRLPIKITRPQASKSLNFIPKVKEDQSSNWF